MATGRGPLDTPVCELHWVPAGLSLGGEPPPLGMVLSGSLRSFGISFFKTKSSRSVWNRQMFLFSCLLVSSWIALGFRVTEEGRAGVSSVHQGPLLVAVTVCEGLRALMKVQKGVCIYCMLAKHILC